MSDDAFPFFVFFAVYMTFVLAVFVPLVFISTVLFAFCEPRTKAARLACFLLPAVVVLTGFFAWYISEKLYAKEGLLSAFPLFGASMGIFAAGFTMRIIRSRVLLQ